MATIHPHIIPTAQNNSLEKAHHFLMPLQNCVVSDKNKYFQICQLNKYPILQKLSGIIRLIIYGEMIRLMRYFILGDTGWHQCLWNKKKYVH